MRIGKEKTESSKKKNKKKTQESQRTEIIKHTTIGTRLKDKHGTNKTADRQTTEV